MHGFLLVGLLNDLQFLDQFLDFAGLGSLFYPFLCQLGCVLYHSGSYELDLQLLGFQCFDGRENPFQFILVVLAGLSLFSHFPLFDALEFVLFVWHVLRDGEPLGHLANPLARIRNQLLFHCLEISTCTMLIIHLRL